MNYRQRPKDFHGHGLPSLDPATSTCLFVEQFEALSSRDIARANPSAMFWPPGWETWDPVDSLDLTYADAEMRCGVIRVHNLDSVDTAGMAAKLRPWPVSEHNNWRVFARIGRAASGTTVLTPPSTELYGILVSTVDLITDGDGEFRFAGSANGSAADLSTWSGASVKDSHLLVGVLSSQLYVQLQLTYDEGDDETTIKALISDDGVGYVGPNPDQIPATTEAVWTMTGRPAVIGLGASQQLDSEADPYTAQVSARLDYLSIFGYEINTFQDGSDAGNSEGARSFYG